MTLDGTSLAHDAPLRGLVRVEPLTVAARDGYPLAATLFASPAPDAPAVLVGSATGVPRVFYARFARFLASRGLSALTLDYRGVGGSAPPRLRGFRATMADWGRLDLAGALDWMEAHLPSSRRLFVGHSVAGQLLGLVPDVDRIAAAWLVGSQHGYLRNWDGPQRALLFPFWLALLPAVVGTVGYLPAWLLGGGEDIPAGVAREWAAWARHPEYVIGLHPEAREGYARLRAPITMVAIEDDFYAPRRAVDRLAALFGSWPSRRLVRPRDLGVPSMGHFGWFHERFAGPLWEDAARWLLAQAMDKGEAA
jgi:predicted alpha/beta hydrolase